MNRPVWGPSLAHATGRERARERAREREREGDEGAGWREFVIAMRDARRMVPAPAPACTTVSAAAKAAGDAQPPETYEQEQERHWPTRG